MDGEASHVPVTWIQAIFNYLETIFVNKKLFVLSILGVQSSGKSTLLNTMFGLQFNVSAGIDAQEEHLSDFFKLMKL